MKNPNSFTKTGAALMIAGAACLVSPIVGQYAHAQTSTNLKNVIPQAEEVTLQAKITAS